MSRAQTTTLGQIADVVGGRLTGGDAASVVEDVTHDSRQAKAGTIFVAIRGARFDGVAFVAEAIERGCTAIISEAERPRDLSAAWIVADDARRALALASDEVQGHPSRELNLVGVTGTNGKTTTCYLIAGIAEAAGRQIALMGTVESRIGGERFKSERTTGEASETQRFLRRAVAVGCEIAVMECSSHAIALHRCDALRFRAAIFTNLTRDHLDYHRTMEDYYASKRRLFDGSLGERPQTSIINIDDKRGASLAIELRATNSQVITYALDDATADVRATDIAISSIGMRFVLHTPYGEREISTPLVGRPHVSNLLAAASCGLTLGYGLEPIASAYASCTGAPGRFERVAHAGPFIVAVDYAHTDDALINVLRTAREITKNRVITVFGCGGDRDRTKRAPMGEAAATLSDFVVLTSDNPRTEEPEAILRDVEVGLKKIGRDYLKFADRRAAIYRAIAEAGEGDLVLIAGKGHEDYQIIGDRTIHFDDREVAREALGKRNLI